MFTQKLLFSLLLIILYLTAHGKCSESTPHNLTFMFITSFGQFGFNSSGALPAADIALEDINRDPNTLPGYSLLYDEVRDSQVLLVICGTIITTS